VARAAVCDDHDDCGNVGGYISKANLRVNEMSSGIENACDLQAMQAFRHSWSLDFFMTSL